MIRVTSAGSWETILWNWLAVLLGSSTVEMILAVTSGSVAMLLTFLTASSTRACGSASTAVDIRLLRFRIALKTVGRQTVGRQPAGRRSVGRSPPFFIERRR